MTLEKLIFPLQLKVSKTSCGVQAKKNIPLTKSCKNAVGG